MPTCTESQTALLEQHERGLSLLCGLHPCMTIDGPPEEVAQRIFDHVMAEQRALLERIESLDRALDRYRHPSRELVAALSARCVSN